MDLDFKLYNEYIRPGGTDSLTYEYFSRLILEGSFFQGGKMYIHIHQLQDILFIFFIYCLAKN